MATYKYEIVKPNGKSKKGTIEAKDEESAKNQLRSDGSFLIACSKASALESDIQISIGSPVKGQEMSVFFRQMQSVIHAGVTIIDALDMLQESTSNKVFKKALVEIRDMVQRGETLSSAMKKYPKIFSEIMVYMVEAGEASGNLEVAFDRLATQSEKSSHTKGLIKKAMIYPIVLLVVVVIIVGVMMIMIIPNLQESIAATGGELPLITQIVIGISNFMVNYWYLLLLSVVLLVLLLRAVKKTEHGAMLFGKFALHAPLFGNLNVKSASATFTRTMSTLMASGIQTIDALEIATNVASNAVIKDALRKTKKEVEVGVPMSKPLEESGVFPTMMYQMIRIGEETGNMEEMLDKVADYYEEEVELATSGLVAAMEPLMIVVMAGVVVPIVLAIYLPMLQIQNNI